MGVIIESVPATRCLTGFVSLWSHGRHEQASFSQASPGRLAVLLQAVQEG